jgi:hypothetical protein
MVGGTIVSNERMLLPVEGKHPKFVRRLWCADRHGDECAVYAEVAAEALKVGEQIWWQSGKIFARDDTMTFHKVGYSFQPPGDAIPAPETGTL